MPATSILSSAPSAGMSGIGNSWISVLLGPVLTAASTFSNSSPPWDLLDRRLRHAGLRLQRLSGAFLEGCPGLEHHRDRADPLVRDVAAGRERAFRGELLRGLHQPMPRHDDAVVGGHEVF